MRIEKIKNSNVLQRGQLLVVVKLWKLLNSGVEAGPVQFYWHRQEASSVESPVEEREIVPSPENNQ